MVDEELLTAAEAAKIFRVTMQTIRNWIQWGKLPALRVGRRFLVRREHIEALLDQAQAADGAHATARDVWDPSVSRLVQPPAAPASASLWDNDSESAPALSPKRG